LTAKLALKTCLTATIGQLVKELDWWSGGRSGIENSSQLVSQVLSWPTAPRPGVSSNKSGHPGQQLTLQETATPAELEIDKQHSHTR
jgi:hypothetical protein